MPEQIDALKARLDRIDERAGLIHGQLVQVLSQLQAPWRFKERCMDLAASTITRSFDLASAVATSGNLKWLALSMVALAVITTGVGATLQWGDWSFTTQRLPPPPRAADTGAAMAVP